MKGGAFALFFSSLSFWFPFQIYKFPRCKAMSVRERDREDVKLKSMSHKRKKKSFPNTSLTSYDIATGENSYANSAMQAPFSTGECVEID